MSEIKSLTFTRNYRVTANTIKSRPNMYVAVWHLAVPINDPIGTFRVKIMSGNRVVAYSDESSWGDVIDTCLILHQWGVVAERFKVWGSTIYHDEDIQNELGCKESGD